MRLQAFVMAVCLLAAPVAHAAGIEVSNPWARATASPMVTTGGVFAEIKNTGTVDDQLLSASSPAADMTQLHTTLNDNGTMMMREVPAFDVKAGQSVVFQPGANHIMLMGLKAPLKKGDHLTLSLTFAKAGVVTVSVPVVAVDAVAALKAP